jgi:hypothetical protein
MSVVTDPAFAVFAALRFWLFNLPTLLRLTWFPLAVASATSHAWTFWNSHIEVWNHLNPDRPSDYSLAYQGGLEGVAVWLTLQLVAISASAAAVHRFVVLGDSQPGSYFSFPFGRSEFSYFGAGIVAYLLMCLLWLGQYAAQVQWPEIDESLVTTVMKAHSALGLFSLSMFLFPGELPVFTQPPLNYALWVLLVMSAFAVMIRLWPWPSLAASEGRFALRETLRLTRGLTGTIVLYGLFAAISFAVVFGALSVAGLGYIVSKPDGLNYLLQSLQVVRGPATETADPVLQAISEARYMAMYFEAAHFVSSVVGISMGAVLTSHLHLLLKRRRG